MASQSIELKRSCRELSALYRFRDIPGSTMHLNYIGEIKEEKSAGKQSVSKHLVTYYNNFACTSINYAGETRPAL